MTALDFAPLLAPGLPPPNTSHEAIPAGVATLAEICRREFGVPDRLANVQQKARG